MSRCIYAESLYKRIDNHLEKLDVVENRNPYDRAFIDGMRTAQDLIDDEPTIEMVKHGKWLKTDKDGFEDVYCSACGCSAYRDEYLNEYIRFTHCPNCGAKMR